MLKLLSKTFAALAKIIHCDAPEKNVVLISRQSSRPSREYEMLRAELITRLGKERVLYCLVEPELKSKSEFISGTLRQLRAVTRNKVIVTDGYSPAISIPPKNKSVYVVQLWHALGAIKKFGYQSVGTPAGRSSAYAAAAHMHENYDAIIASGPGAIDAYSEAFGYSTDAVLTLGSPQLDYLLQTAPDSPRMQAHAHALATLPYLKNGNLNVLYAPTLRKGAGYENWEDKYLRALCEACPKENVNLIFSGHPLEQEAGEGLMKDYPFLHVPRDFATTDLLESADVVITDYSSLALDAGFLDKNVCFYVPDYDQYAQSPGLNIDVMDQSIAFASRDAMELMAGVCKAMTPEAPVGFSAFRQFAERYFSGIKPGSTQRIAEFICSKLEAS